MLCCRPQLIVSTRWCLPAPWPSLPHTSQPIDVQRFAAEAIGLGPHPCAMKTTAGHVGERLVTDNHPVAGRQHCSSLRPSDQFEDGPAGMCAAIAAPSYTMRCTGQVCVQTQHCVTYVGFTMHVLCFVFRTCSLRASCVRKAVRRCRAAFDNQ